mgnify:CR=1 FL=1
MSDKKERKEHARKDRVGIRAFLASKNIDNITILMYCDTLINQMSDKKLTLEQAGELLVQGGTSLESIQYLKDLVQEYLNSKN